MKEPETKNKNELLPGTLEMLILKTLSIESMHGYGIAQLPLVVNFDLPLVAEDYVHRVGRTGRAGAAGRALSLATTSDRQLLHAIQQLLSAPLECVTVAGFEPTTNVASQNDARRFNRTRAPRAANPSPRRTRRHSRSRRVLGFRPSAGPAAPTAPDRPVDHARPFPPPLPFAR